MTRQKQPLAKLLSEYQPHPGKSFYTRMENAPWRGKETKMMDHPFHPNRLGWQFAIGLLVVIALLSLSIPAVRASLSAWLGLSAAPSNQMPAVSVTLVGITPSTPTLGATAIATTTVPALLPTATQASPLPTGTTAPAAKPAEIKQLSAQAGWVILTPAHLPDGFHFESGYYDTNHQMTILTYLVTRPLPGAADPSLTTSKTITLLQAQKNDFVPMQIAPDTNVEDIQVNGQPAAYAVGAWDAHFVKDDNDPNDGKMVSTWRNDLPVQNLYWQVGKMYLLLVTDDETVSKQDLIDMAASIVG